MSEFTKIGLLWVVVIFLVWNLYYAFHNNDENKSLVLENMSFEGSVLEEVSEELNVETDKKGVLANEKPNVNDGDR